MQRAIAATTAALAIAVVVRVALHSWLGQVWAEYVALLVLGLSLAAAGFWKSWSERRARAQHAAPLHNMGSRATPPSFDPDNPA